MRYRLWWFPDWPNITPIFIRIWLMKITMQLDLEIDPVNLRQCLAHKTGLKARQTVAHFAFEFSARG